MDYVARQFINLTKKFRKESRKVLTELLHSLQQHTEAIRKANERRDNKHEPQQPPLVVRAELYVPEDVEKDRRSHEERQHRLQVWIVIGTWAAFIAGSIYAYVAVRQWREMISTRHQTQHAIEAANRAAKAAEDANADASEHFRQDERPYVSLNLALGPPAGQQQTPSNTGSLISLDLLPDTDNHPTGRVIWSIHYKNYGKSPALNIRITKQVEVGPDAFKKVHWISSETSSGPMVAASEDGFVSAYSGVLPQKEIVASLAKDIQVVIFGHIDYEGLDGTSYWTEFCLFRLATQATAFCPSHNLMK